MATTLAVAAAAVNPAQTGDRPTRHRPQRDEREKRRALQAKKDSTDPATSGDLVEAPAQNQLDWLPLADAQAAPCPVVFSPDSAYCFIASGSQVKIYSTVTTELLSSLSNRSSLNSSLRGKVSTVLLHPSNPRQLVVGSTDGLIRVWDYLEGKLLRTLDCQSPVTLATAHPSLPDQLFVALANPSLKKTSTEAGSKEEEQSGGGAGGRGLPVRQALAGIYMISLRAKRSQVSSSESRPANDPSMPLPPSRRIRLALPRVVRSLSLSPDGSTLISLNPNAINVCKTQTLQQGFTRSIPVLEEELTTLAFHPTETYFATGNSRGQIRLWYNVLDSNTTTGGEVDLTKKKPAPTTSLLHWHVHPISSLSFTPNGAYLLSGGQEAVIVLWQLHTNHQEYVPRLGAPIQTLTVVEGGREGGGEQMVAARLADGSVVFVGSQRLKIEKTIAGLKSDSITAPTTSSRSDRPVPLAVDPVTSNLVLPSGHPASLQFYSPAQDSQALELEVSPSNRVTSATEKMIEPTRVERVAFSSPEAESGKYWMATVDEWQSGEYNPVRHLKFWRNKGDSQSFSLSTRVDRPHTLPLTSLSFSPSPAHPLLLTTSLDSSIKLWSYSASAWQCRTALSRRNLVPLASSFSKDGSMFAVAFNKDSVGVWSTSKAEEICTFSSRSVGEAKEVLFAGEEGTELVLVGQEGTVCWDLLTLEETFSSSVAYSTVVPSTLASSTLLVTETSSSTPQTTLSTLPLDPLSPSTSTFSTRTVPFSVSQSVSLPSISTSNDPSLAVVDSDSRIILVGPLAKSSGSIAPSRLPQANQGQNPGLFDEIFGSEDQDRSTTTNSFSLRYKGKDKVQGGGGEGLEILGTPAHSLPPVKLLWRSMLLASPPSAQLRSDSGEEEGVVVGMEIEGEEDTRSENAKEETITERKYNDSSPPGSLADIFRARLKLAI